MLCPYSDWVCIPIYSGFSDATGSLRSIVVTHITYIPSTLSCTCLVRRSPPLYNHSISASSECITLYFDSLDLDQNIEAMLRNLDWLRRSKSDCRGPSIAPNNVYSSNHNEANVLIVHPKLPSLRIRQHPIRFPNNSPPR